MPNNKKKPYIVIASNNSDELEERLCEAHTDGYRIVSSFSFAVGFWVKVIMELKTTPDSE